MIGLQALFLHIDLSAGTQLTAMHLSSAENECRMTFNRFTSQPHRFDSSLLLNSAVTTM